jgi:hypothetical protein
MKILNIYLNLLDKKVTFRNKYHIIYIKLIEKAIARKNKKFKGEKHHIYPVSFSKNNKLYNKDKNNLVKLTYREHFIAHRLLSKLSFISNEDHRSMLFAVSCFMKNSKKRINSRQFEIAKKSVIKALTGKPKSNEEKNNLSKSRMGKCVFYDKDGNKYFLNTDDPLISKLNLVGNRKNTIIAKDKSGNVVFTHNKDEKYLNGDLVGIAKGKSTYISKDGKKYTLDINDSLIKELDLSHINLGRKFKMPDHVNKGKNNPMYGRNHEVVCFDLQDLIFLRIKKEKFDAESRYVGVNNIVAKKYRKLKNNQ